MSALKKYKAAAMEAEAKLKELADENFRLLREIVELKSDCNALGALVAADIVDFKNILDLVKRARPGLIEQIHSERYVARALLESQANRADR